MEQTYHDYFEIDQTYFPQITDSSIEKDAGLWRRTYPHETFIYMLESLVRVMERLEKRSLWISGAYGTGKSRCAYTLKKLLDVPEEDVRSYWERYEALKKKQDLFDQLMSIKRSHVVTVYRYAGTPSSSSGFLLAVQDSVLHALRENGLYEGAQTLKDSVIAWLEAGEDNRTYMDSKLKKPQWQLPFGGMTAADVLDRLKSGADVSMLMENIMQMSETEKVWMMEFVADRLTHWLKDVIDKNKVKVVFIWDEFSDFFRASHDHLSDFQKVAEVCDSAPFFFIPITHETDSSFTTDEGRWQTVRDRFVFANISLPDNTAFHLIGNAFKPKPVLKDDWAEVTDVLNARVGESRRRVMQAAKIDEESVIKGIFPLHPMAALVLKHIATSFKSNQRSMFDFILGAKDEHVKTFQYFIDVAGPKSPHPFLTIDQLWDFFYVHGKSGLEPHIRMILDTFDQQQGLRDDEKTVLKTILIMLAINKQLAGSLDILHPTEQNIHYAFEGDSDLGMKAPSIAGALKDKGILIEMPTRAGKEYDLAYLSGDQGKIEGYKKDLKEKAKTAKLVDEGNLQTLLMLSPEGLKVRFADATGALPTVTIDNFTYMVNRIAKDAVKPWRYRAVSAFAKDEREAQVFREKIREAAKKEEYREVIFIDALSTPLGLDAFDRYVDASAMARYYQGSNNVAANQQAREAKNVLAQEWKNRICEGKFIVYSRENPEGIQIARASDVSEELKRIVLVRNHHAFDLEKKTTEAYYRTGSLKNAAYCGINGDVKQQVRDAEKNVLPEVWNLADYEKNAATRALTISDMKRSLEAIIQTDFEAKGQVEVGTLCAVLTDRYGFPPCALSAFLLGFLLRPYGEDTFRYGDDKGRSEVMTQAKLAEMIGDYVGWQAKEGTKEPAASYIVKMTKEERSFYRLTQEAWGISASTCQSVQSAATAVQHKMRVWKLPLWCLPAGTESETYLKEVALCYADLVQKPAAEAHPVAIALGERALGEAELGKELQAYLTLDTLERGMRDFLQTFDGGILPELAESVGASGELITDIRQKFDKDYGCLWQQETGEGILRSLATEYRVARTTNEILHAAAKSWPDTRASWRERLRHFPVSAECMEEADASLSGVLRYLLQLLRGEDISTQLSAFADAIEQAKEALSSWLQDKAGAFARVNAVYLEGIPETGIQVILSKMEKGFSSHRSEYCEEVSNRVKEYRRTELVEQLATLWMEKTGTSHPHVWADRHQTPVLSCVGKEEFARAQKAFELIERRSGRDDDLREAIAFLQGARFFDVLADKAKYDKAFRKDIIGAYAKLLPDIEEVRQKLASLRIPVRNWRADPRVRERIEQIAKANYEAGGAKKVQAKIDRMGDDELKHYLKRLIRDNMKVGMEILESD